MHHLLLLFVVSLYHLLCLLLVLLLQLLHLRLVRVLLHGTLVFRLLLLGKLFMLLVLLGVELVLLLIVLLVSLGVAGVRRSRLRMRLQVLGVSCFLARSRCPATVGRRMIGGARLFGSYNAAAFE